MTRLLATGILFQKNKKDRLVRQASILQDILKYLLKIDENKQFNQKELSDWLADNTNSFDFERNTPRKYRRDKVSMEIGSLLEPLIKLGLISQTWPESESNVKKELILLRYTKAGLLLAHIIDNFDLERRLEDNRKIYEILQTYHSVNKSSKHQFFLNLFKIYYKQDNLDDLTEIIRKALEVADHIPVTDLMDIYEIVTVIYFNDIEKARNFISNWKTALNNLKPSIRNIFLYDIKLECEAKMGDCKDLGDPVLYENYIFDLEGGSRKDSISNKMHRL